MSKKLNCWDYMNCGREKGGIMVPTLGECLVQSEMKYDGLNDGVGGGRACWMITDNNCAMKHNKSCFNCKFYKRVLFEEEEKVLFKIVLEEV